MKRALIGHTGFVGGNLLTQAAFTHTYHSKTIDAIRGESFDHVVCAGAPAEKWKANQDPEADRTKLARLTAALAEVRARRVVLISTVDVFPTPCGVDEDTPIDAAAACPYGRHRYELERWVAGRFDTLVVRLPALFGPGLKKNVVYDLLHRNQVERINPEAVFQFYDLANLGHDLAVAESLGVSLVHFATEPVAVAEMAQAAFGETLRHRPPGAPARYDFWSRHSGRFGGSGAYLYRKADILEALCRFVRAERLRLAGEDERQCA
jgi:nucleoside-diphosphate-sugar epimerase